MFLKLIDSLAFLSIIVSATASLLALCTFTYLGSKIPYDIIALIFSGTLSIYNIDHLRGLKSDSGTNPLRTVFIRKYLLNIKIIIVISLIFSLFLGFKTGLLELYWLLPAIFLGLLHRRIKNNNLFSGIYITISWLIVTVIFPASIHGKLSQIFLPSLIIGTALFSNAYISSSKDKPNHLHKAKISLIIATLGTLIVFINSIKHFSLIPIPGLTAFALVFYSRNEKFEIIYLDGALLIGSIISLLFLSL